MKTNNILSSYHEGESHHISYTEWGDPDNPELLFCAHGLSRNGRDFDVLAKAMSDRYHVVCPDYPGRGQSEKLANPKDYTNLNYMIDSQTIISALNKDTVDWVGTSMGGIIGMFIDSQGNSPICNMILNDVGAFIPKSSLQELAEYLRIEPHFETREDARRYFEKTYIGFGPMSDEQIDHLAQHGIWPLDTGGYQLSCDPEILRGFVNADLQDVDLWRFWNQMRAPTLLIRGAYSRLLTTEDMEKMKQSREKITTVEFPLCGHAPSLMHPDHIQLIRKWLDSSSL